MRFESVASFMMALSLGVLLVFTGASPLPEESKGGWVRSRWSIDSIQPASSREGRQFGGLQDLGKVVDSVGKFDLREVSKFLKEIPELFESVEKIVEGVDTSFGEGD